VVTRQSSSGIEGIAKNQGANTLQAKDQAGNTFSPYHLEAHISESDIKNVANNIIYYHHIQADEPGAPRVKPDFILQNQQSLGNKSHLTLITRCVALQNSY
jgi:hypothetical protein